MVPTSYLIFAFLLNAGFSLTPPKCKKCTMAYKCTPYFKRTDELAWAIVDGGCRVFANGCMRDSFNCQRIKNCTSEIEISTKEECQKCCDCNCQNASLEPHYSWINENGKDYCLDFPNERLALQISCITSTPLNGLTPGKCPKGE